VIIYPLIMVLVFGLLVGVLVGKESADITILRGIGAPFVQLPDGRISNQIRVKIVNRSDETQEYLIEIQGGEDLELIAPQNPLPVAKGATEKTTIFVIGDKSVFEDGSLNINLRLSDGAEFTHDHPYRLLGPIDNRDRE
jgi:polyferredoxin